MRKVDQSEIAWRNLFFVVPPVLVLIMADVFRDLVNVPPAIVLKDIARPELSGFDAAGRLYLISALLFTCVMTAFATLLFAKDLATEFGRDMRNKLLATLIVGLVIGGTWSFYWRYLNAPTSIDTLGLAFLESAAVEFRRTASGTIQGQHYADIKALIEGSRVVLMIGAAVTIVGAVSCAVHPTTHSVPERVFIARQRARLRGYVNAAAALMLGNILFEIAWTRWPIPLLSSEMLPAFEARVNAMAVYTGAALSLAIATFALPVLTILQSRASELPVPAGGTAENADLGSGLLQSLGKVLIVLAPAIAGALPGVFEALRHLGG